MSALEQALRQIEKERLDRKGDAGVRGIMPGIMLDSRGQVKESRRGLTIAVVLLSLACAGTWLMMLGFLPVGTQDVSRWRASIPSVGMLFSRTNHVATQEQASSDPGAPVAAPGLAPAAAPVPVRNGATSLPITVASAPVNPMQAPPAASNAVAPNAAVPNTAVSNTAPVSAAPAKPVSPQSAPMPLAAQPVAPLKPPMPAPAAASVTAPVPALASPAPAAPRPLVVAAAPQLAAPKVAAPAATPAASPVAKPMVAAAAPGVNAAEDEPELVRKPVTNSKTDAEPPQLSRTDTDRLSTTGQASAAAKAIDVDYQMIERSLARGDHQAALESVGKLEKYIGDNWRTRYLTGVALMGLNRWDQAIVALSKAQDLNPTHAMSALYLSVALQERGEHTRAIQVLDKALISLPNSPELWLNLGHSHDALGHKADAKTAYNRFMELSVNRQDLAGQRVWVLNRVQKDK